MSTHTQLDISTVEEAVQQHLEAGPSAEVVAQIALQLASQASNND